MKRLLYIIRLWLLGLLHGEPEEYAEEIEDMHIRIISAQSERISLLIEAIALYKKAIREICRRSENTYYDWCCEYCCMTHNCRRDGWCNRFWPRKVPDEK